MSVVSVPVPVRMRVPTSRFGRRPERVLASTLPFGALPRKPARLGPLHEPVPAAARVSLAGQLGDGAGLDGGEEPPAGGCGG